MDALGLSLAAAVVSSMAAMVSAATTLLAFHHQRTTTSPRIEVSASIARVFFAGATDWGQGQVAIEVVNTGLFAVDVRSVGVIGKDGQEGVLMSHKDLLGQPVLPTRLDAQSSVTIAGDVKELRKWEAEHGLRTVWVRTAAGNTFRSKWTASLPDEG
jgi:hypothetical protein